MENDKSSKSHWWPQMITERADGKFTHLKSFDFGRIFKVLTTLCDSICHILTVPSQLDDACKEQAFNECHSGTKTQQKRHLLHIPNTFRSDELPN